MHTPPTSASLNYTFCPDRTLFRSVVPGAFDACMLMLRDYGTRTVRDVLEPAIFYAEHGHPMLPRVAETIAEMAEFFRDEWPTSAAAWLPGGDRKSTRLNSSH